ncbi:MAG: hypothetical protein ACD_61C00079G0003 [uncultured bacterium]|nr:MAG: hypothetical protein ACD_61C00079G0003 [uncultured bacterium]
METLGFGELGTPEFSDEQLDDMARKLKKGSPVPDSEIIAATTQMAAEPVEIQQGKEPEETLDTARGVVGMPEPKEKAPVQGKAWYDGLGKDLLEASRAPRVWKDPKDHSKGTRTNDQIEADKQKIREATERLRTQRIKVDGLSDRETRNKIADARRLVFGGVDSVRSGMTVDEARVVLDGMGVDTSKIGSENQQQQLPQQGEVGEAVRVAEPVPAGDKWQNKLDATLEIIGGYSAGSKKQALENLRREMVKDLAPAGILRSVEGMLESPDLVARPVISLTEAERQAEPVYGNFDAVRQKEAAQRWLDRFGGVVGAEEMRRKMQEIVDYKLELSPAQEDLIRTYCLEGVFDRGANGEKAITQGLFGETGYLFTELGIPQDKLSLVRERVNEIAKELGLDNFISIRNVVTEWNGLNKLEDITSSGLRSGLFVPKYTEDWFEGDYDKQGNRQGERWVTLPEIGRVNMQVEVSKAMLALKNFFDSNDYWEGYVGVAQEKKNQLYESLGINKYIGEVAFGMAMSNLIFTDTKGTSLDPFLLMIHGESKRRKMREVDIDREKTVQAFFQYRMATTGKKPSMDEVEVWLSEHYPSHLIPTGLSGGGLRALERGEWLQWRVQENLYSGAQRSIEVTFETNREKWIQTAERGFAVDGVNVRWTEAELMAIYGRKQELARMGARARLQRDNERAEIMRTGSAVERQRAEVEITEEKQLDKEWKALTKNVTELGGVKIATDIETRILEMKTALDLLIALKEVMTPGADLDKIAKFKSKCIVHWKTSMSAAGIVSGGMIPEEFSLIPGQRQSVDEWVGSVTVTACEAYLHENSVANFLNPNPLSMDVLSEKAELLMSTNVQTPEINRYIWTGKDSEKTEPLLRNKRNYISYVDKLWKSCFDVIDKVSRDLNPKDYPWWWSAGVRASAKIRELAIAANKPDKTGIFPRNYWENAKKAMKLQR